MSHTTHPRPFVHHSCVGTLLGTLLGTLRTETPRWRISSAHSTWVLTRVLFVGYLGGNRYQHPGRSVFDERGVVVNLVILV